MRGLSASKKHTQSLPTYDLTSWTFTSSHANPRGCTYQILFSSTICPCIPLSPADKICTSALSLTFQQLSPSVTLISNTSSSNSPSKSHSSCVPPGSFLKMPEPILCLYKIILDTFSRKMKSFLANSSIKDPEVPCSTFLQKTYLLIQSLFNL